MARAAGDDLTSATPHLAQRVGGRIRARRTSLGQTLTQTAKAAEVSVSHLSSIETGANLPSLPILARVAAALGLTLNEVLRLIAQGATSASARAPGNRKRSLLRSEPSAIRQMIGSSRAAAKPTA